ncbi:MAG TPA: DUF3971 domain-containing protein, partial [Methylophilaceae bacterium]|nr:DUF3971 domain-containing protein [Methylophilaceae bacterium]
QQIRLATADGLNMQDGNLGIRARQAGTKNWIEGDAAFDEVRLETLNAFAAYLPLSAESLQKIADVGPQGELRKLSLHWKGSTANETGKYKLPEEYTLRTQFAGLGIKAFDAVPGFSNLSGGIDANESRGMLTLNAKEAILDFSKVFRTPIPADTLKGQIQWTRGKDGLDFRFHNLALANAHLAGSVNGRYLDRTGRDGYLDLQAALSRADAKYARTYYPLILSEHLITWLDRAILGGQGSDIKVALKGNLHDFPYPEDRNGLFKVTAKVSNGVLDFADGWPKIDGIKLDLLFHGSRMELNASEGNLLGNRITQAKVVIPVLNTPQPILTVNGQAQGPVSEAIRYVNSSPLQDIAGGFTRDLQTSGNGKLNLQLTLPIENLEAVKVKAAYTVANGSLASPDIPILTKLNGKLDITENGVQAQNVNTWIYGGPAQFTLTTGKDKVHRIAAHGSITDAGLKEAFGPSFADRLSGTTDWLSDITIHQQAVDVTIRSSMVGMTSTLPPPLAKAAEDRMPVRLEKRQQSPEQDVISANFGNIIGARFVRVAQAGKLEVDRGDIGLNVLPQLPAQRGISIHGVLDKLDLDEWRNLFDKTTASMGGADTGSGRAPVNSVNMSVGTLDVFGRRINGLSLNAKAVSSGWNLNLKSREITGDVQWLSQGEGKIIARLKTLIMPSATPDIAQLRTQGNFQEQAEDDPALDVVAESFEIAQKKLGRLELLASERNEDWSIEKLRISNPESTLNAEGEWHNWIRSPNTRMTLTWT